MWWESDNARGSRPHVGASPKKSHLGTEYRKTPPLPRVISLSICASLCLCVHMLAYVYVCARVCVCVCVCVCGMYVCAYCLPVSGHPQWCLPLHELGCRPWQAP